MTLLYLLTDGLLLSCRKARSEMNEISKHAESSTYKMEIPCFECTHLLEDENKEMPLVNTPLINAVSNGHERCLNALIKTGADVNYANTEGSTALMAAAFFGHDKYVAAFIQAGADVNLKDIYGETSSTKLNPKVVHNC